jgi:ATPase subunit of ABC transporter with duplicated ATPase domains
MQTWLETQDLGWSWPGASTPALENIDLSLPSGLSGLVGPNGSGKSLLLSLLGGTRRSMTGIVRVKAPLGLLNQHAAEVRTGTVAGALGFGSAWQALLRMESGQGLSDDADLLEGFWDLPERLSRALERSGLSLDPSWEMACLSGGERVRVALSRLILEGAKILLLDEPTNHLDATSRDALCDLLASWDGAVLVASHERTLLRRCTRLYELEQGRLHLWDGNWDAYREGREALSASLDRQEADARKALRLARETRQEAMERQQKRQSAGRKDAQGGGMPKILAGMRKRNAEGTASRLREVHDGQLDQARTELEQRSLRRPDPLFLDLELPDSSRGAVGLSDFMPCPVGTPLWDAPLSVEWRAPERLALIGPNGSGKSLTLRALSGRNLSYHGEIRKRGRIAFLDQELAILGKGSAREVLTCHSPPGSTTTEIAIKLGRLRLRGSRADLIVESLSGGERLRLALACLLAGGAPPDVLLLDEPTNHLDLESVATLVEALRDWKGLLVIATHDADLLEELEVEISVELA